MGQIMVDNQYDASYLESLLRALTGRRPVVEGGWNYQGVISDDQIPQSAMDAIYSTYRQNKVRGMVEVENPMPSIEEREGDCSERP